MSGKKKISKKSSHMEDTEMREDRGSTSKKGGRPSKSKSGSSRFQCSLGRPTNDPRWYLNNPVLSRDVGSLWFSKPVGSYLPKSAIFTGTPSTPSSDQLEPGILAFPSILTWGGNVLNVAGDVSNDPINLTAQKLYQYVVHANSRNISYDKKDLLMTIMAIDGVYQIITDAIRAYRLIASYDPENRFVSRLLEAMNWDPQSLRSNVAEFRYQINWAISRVNKFYVPGIFDIIKAHISAYEHVYADRPSNKAQYVVKYPRGFWLYNDIEGDLNYYITYTNSSGVTVDYTQPRTLNTFRDTIRMMISEIENAQYLGVMQGDLLKAFGVGNLMQYAYLGIDMPIAPVYDEEFMLKLHNADIAKWRIAAHTVTTGQDSMMTYRDDNAVSGNVQMLMANSVGPASLMAFRTTYGMMIDLPTHIPADSSSVLLMSLYKLLGSVGVSNYKWRLSDGSASTAYIGQVGPEVLLQAYLYYDPNNMANLIPIDTWSQNITSVSLLSRFETAPLLTQENVAAGSEVPIFWKTDNVSDISWETVRRMFEVIYWSLWASSAITSSVSREERV